MEKIIKKPNELELGETYRFYFKKKPKEEAFDFVEGIVDLVNKQKIRIVGIFKNNRIFKLFDFLNFKKVVRPEYDILLPKEIILRSLVKNKANFDSDFIKKEKNVKIKNVVDILHLRKKIRYFFPSPISQDHLYIDCLVKEVNDTGFVLQGFDTEDGRNFIVFVKKDSDCLIQFLNKNVKLPNELKEEYQHITKEDYKIFEDAKKNVYFPKHNKLKKEKYFVAEKKNRGKNTKIKEEEEKINKAILKKKSLRKEEN